MFSEIRFDSPWYFLLLLLIPVVIQLGRKSLSVMTRSRGAAAILVRAFILLLLIAALAETQTLQRHDRMTVIYLLDQSQSIPSGQRQAMVEYVVREVEAHRREEQGDRVGVIVFGDQPAIEFPPTDAPLPPLKRLSSLTTVETDETNLAGALQLAQASLQSDSSGRIVVVSDGNETIGDALPIARSLAASGVGIDVAPVFAPPSSAEVIVEKLTTPETARVGQAFQASVVLTNETPEGGEARVARGKLSLIRKAGASEVVMAEQEVELPPGKKVFSFENMLDEANFYSYQVRFTPQDKQDDLLTQNNEATSFVNAHGKGRILLIEDWERTGQFDHLVERLKKHELEVDVQPSNQLFTSLAELQPYDAVILADVPRASGATGEEITSFSDRQVELLVRNTQQLGCGLLILGGPSSFGAGGWANTKLEEASPVRFTIRDAKVVPVGALMLVLDKSGSMQGEKMQMTQGAALAAIRAMGGTDFAGVIGFDSQAQRIVPIRQVDNPGIFAAQVRKLSASGGTNMTPGVALGFRDLQNVEAGVKHMIVLSDGQTEPGNVTQIASDMRKMGMTVSTVAVGGDADHKLMSTIARNGGGKFYAVNNPKAIPRIFMREARRVAQPLVKEVPGMSPGLYSSHEILQGVDGLPTFDGFVMTTVKDSPLVEVGLIAPVPKEHPENATLLASWQYGLGRTVVFTSDAGARWTNRWTEWDGYDKFFLQMVRYAMRPTGDQSDFAVATEEADGKVRVIVSALDPAKEGVNFLNVVGAAVTPEMESENFSLTQTAPGRYEGTFPARESGSYFLSLATGPGRPILRTGVNISYSAEYLRRPTNLHLLEQLAGNVPKGGEAGKVIDDATTAQNAQSMVDTFRRGLPAAISLRQAWPWVLVLAATAFVGDVAFRRITIGWEWLIALRRWIGLKLKGDDKEDDDRLERLRATKRRTAEGYQASARFEAPQPVETKETSGAATTEQADAVRLAGGDNSLSGGQAGDEDYVSRLLKAKRQARQESEASGDRPSADDDDFFA
ncbi:VWA domain-containing protein [Blastopirellula sp. JC732]|uniref:VWA domain-containing protein n=1 Tax=Blastopirellula sediminis TaxID=2894196 RepID=A0A9X1MT73_9BACT|nr:VWA domain-containing protein [Blastopirellula sediminis]MCC9605058.1 VWA domain-containing protein [Blastopirellula sediminis]MCC9631642.1 VWA domain-containing protein [Blastopirellula sediminis]